MQTAVFDDPASRTHLHALYYYYFWHNSISLEKVDRLGGPVPREVMQKWPLLTCRTCKIHLVCNSDGCVTYPARPGRVILHSCLIAEANVTAGGLCNFRRSCRGSCRCDRPARCSPVTNISATLAT